MDPRDRFYGFSLLFNIFAEKKTYYAGIVLDAPSIVLCSKLCRLIVSDPTPVNKSSYVCSQHSEPNSFIKPMGGQRTRLKPDSVPTKFIFTIEKPRRKKPADRASLNTKKTNTEKSQPARIQSPNLSILKTVLYTPIWNRVHNGIETKHLESEDLV